MPASNRYQETQIMTASPMQLIVMMYDEAINALERAEKAFGIDSVDRIEQINNHVLHAEDIITELAVSLDMEKGGEIAKNLHRLYDFMIFYLSKGNVEKNAAPVSEVKKMLIELREAWDKVKSQEPGQEERFESAKSTIAING